MKGNILEFTANCQLLLVNLGKVLRRCHGIIQFHRKRLECILCIQISSEWCGGLAAATAANM
jgi:hypothetical protein